MMCLAQGSSVEEKSEVASNLGDSLKHDISKLV